MRVWPEGATPCCEINTREINNRPDLDCIHTYVMNIHVYGVDGASEARGAHVNPCLTSRRFAERAGHIAVS